MSKTNDTKLIEHIRELSRPLEPKPTDLQATLTPLPYIRAVMFDIYGTLLTSERPRARPATSAIDEAAFHSALAAAGWKWTEIPKDFDASTEIQRRIQRDVQAKRKEGLEHPEVDVRGMWRDVIAEALGTSPKKLDEAALEQFAVDLECRLNPVWCMPGLAQTLSELQSRGIKIGLVSDAQFYTRLELEAMLGKPLESAGVDPSCCIYSYQVGTAKPSPHLYEEAMIALENEHAILCDEVLHVGCDMLEDILPASNMGFKTALFAGDARSLRLRDSETKQDTLDASPPPDRILTDLRQLSGMLSRASRPSKGPRLDLEASAGDDD